MNIGLILPNWIGDVVMATPAIRAIRHRYPEAKLIGVMRPYVSRVLSGTDWLNEVILYDRKSNKPDEHFWPVASQLRSKRLYAIVLFPNTFRFGFLGLLSGAKIRIGYDRDGRGFMLTHRLTVPRSGRRWQPIPAVDYYLNLAYAIGCPPEAKRLELATLPEEERGADIVWKNLGLAAARRVFLLNIGSANAPSKRWPNEHHVQLAQRIVADHSDVHVLVICGPSEKKQAQEITRSADHPRVLTMADQDLSLGVSKAVIRRSQMLVSTDSGPRHIGHAFDVPVVCLSGPIDPRWTETYHPRSIVVQHPVPCGPCGKAVCPLGHHACMRDLSVDAVYAAVQKILAQPVQRKAA